MAFRTRTSDPLSASLQDLLSRSSLPPCLHRLYRQVLALRTGQDDLAAGGSMLTHVTEAQSAAWRLSELASNPSLAPAQFRRTQAEMKAFVAVLKSQMAQLVCSPAKSGSLGHVSRSLQIVSVARPTGNVTCGPPTAIHGPMYMIQLQSPY
ncbi:hypothetical protein WJX73_007459 [Symbiochloris irregularis]|uniref:Uncharacterized protein n=1 Tax=Symbiochloris irregularis TaxID=706552 RepID=A0AAW1NL46_9CHLO